MESSIRNVPETDGEAGGGLGGGCGGCQLP